VQIATAGNAYDIELYTWAAERFDEIVAEQDSEFALEVAGLRAAQSAAIPQNGPPQELSRDDLWRLLVERQSALLRRELDLVRLRHEAESKLLNLVALTNTNVRA